jgi:hypothetical protein
MANKFTDATFNAELPMLEKSVLYVLAYRSNNDTGECWTSYNSIARYAGIARSSAEKGVKALLDRGLISIVGKREVRAGKQVNIYKLNLEKIHALAITARRYAPIPESGIGDESIPGDGTGLVPRDGAATTATRYLTLPINSSRITRPEQYSSGSDAETDEEMNGEEQNLGETPNPQDELRRSNVYDWATTVSRWAPIIQEKDAPYAFFLRNYPKISRHYDSYMAKVKANGNRNGKAKPKPAADGTPAGAFEVGPREREFPKLFGEEDAPSSESLIFEDEPVELEDLVKTKGNPDSCYFGLSSVNPIVGPKSRKAFDYWLNDQLPRLFKNPSAYPKAESWDYLRKISAMARDLGKELHFRGQPVEPFFTYTYTEEIEDDVPDGNEPVIGPSKSFIIEDDEEV